jgi:hypothetical protein
MRPNGKLLFYESAGTTDVFSADVKAGRNTRFGSIKHPPVYKQGYSRAHPVALRV